MGSTDRKWAVLRPRWCSGRQRRSDQRRAALMQRSPAAVKDVLGALSTVRAAESRAKETSEEDEEGWEPSEPLIGISASWAVNRSAHDAHVACNATWRTDTCEVWRPHHGPDRSNVKHQLCAGNNGIWLSLTTAASRTAAHVPDRHEFQDILDFSKGKLRRRNRQLEVG
jgi:hypothetical protein